MQGKYKYAVKYLKKHWEVKKESWDKFVTYLNNNSFNKIKQEKIYKDFVNNLM